MWFYAMFHFPPNNLVFSKLKQGRHLIHNGHLAWEYFMTILHHQATLSIKAVIRHICGINSYLGPTLGKRRLFRRASFIEQGIYWTRNPGQVKIFSKSQKVLAICRWKKLKTKGNYLFWRKCWITENDLIGNRNCK